MIDLQHWSEFVVEVKRFTLWSYQEGFGLKQSPVNRYIHLFFVNHVIFDYVSVQGAMCT